MNKYLLQKFSSGMHYAAIDSDVVFPFIDKGNRRAICIINQTEILHCAFMPLKGGGYYINIGSTICKRLKLKTGMEITLEFKEDTTQYQFDMPEELNEVFLQDVDAFNIFQQLTDGTKRGLIYLVNLVKSSDKKIERSLEIAEKLKAGVHSPALILK